ncbi:transglycosylase SLT domain-containing protein [Iamia sp.]|uniref:transglycosylase SLT domain-containing protein n=1 Tax=Iamia sp. TaxID=2722710 RepID=UPI002C210F9A|nr:transglycosylase SLT domain-containing protein [Iamia sp.]HXH58578.1 transglycosylase SLT domain-containing protein [Iamia sp.]
MKRILLPVLCIVGLAVGASACTPEDLSKDAIRQNFPSSQHDKATRVADCESSLNPEAVSPGGGNWGLFQINTVHKPMVERMGYSWEQITDPYVNAKVARRIFADAGDTWGPWACRGA